MINNELAVRKAVQEYAVPGHRFYMSELTSWVKAKIGPISPETPARRLRELKADGTLDYTVRNSVYEVIG